jgi:hypothetical protein
LVECAERLLLGPGKETDRADAADGIKGCLVQRVHGQVDWTALGAELRLTDTDEFIRAFAIGFLVDPVAAAGYYRLIGRLPGSEGGIAPEQRLRDWVE